MEVVFAKCKNIIHDTEITQKIVIIMIIINKVLARKNSYPPLSFWDSQGTVEPLVVLDSGPKL